MKHKPKPLQSIAEIEGSMAWIMLQGYYPAARTEYHRLLKIMGNVDGDEIIPLVIVAFLESKGPLE